jgi:hypothetical protein
MQSTKTDNHNPYLKLCLRRYFLRKYHTDGVIDVLDCCQGSAVLWTELQREFAVSSYWGVDLKAKKGRVKIDSVRILQQPGWTQNVIDCDVYGSPWKHWREIVRNLSRPTTVFLTVGQWQMGTDAEILKAVGLGKMKIPPGIAIRLHGFALPYLLSTGGIVECREAMNPGGSARYLGVRLEPH